MFACALAALALALPLSGCGAEEQANDPRPPIPADVSVSISESRISAQPRIVGVVGGGQETSQNVGVKNPELSSKTPLNVVFTIANLTDTDTRIEIQGPRRGRSGLVVGSGTSRYELALPTGEYRLAATEIPDALPAPFAVGPNRVSSQNDLLLP